VPVGVAGELCIGGVGLARGYLNRPALTAEKFVPCPFDADAGARLYRTGDLARFRPDGRIEFLGRLDHQVKVRGFRIEPGEVEAALGTHPRVGVAAVTAIDDGLVGKRLVAYLTAAGGEAPTTGELHSYLRERLPEYMVPSVFVVLSEMPLTLNGKVDRKALPAPGQERPAVSAGYVEPRNSVEETLAGVWAELLGVERVGVYDNFFELGGHSLRATQVVSRVRSTFGADLSLACSLRRRPSSRSPRP
jgi:hypothetical protein